MSDMVDGVRLPTARRCPFDLPEEFGRFRDDGPVTPFVFPDGRRGWLVTRYADVRAALADPRFTSRHARLTSPVRKPVLSEADRADNLLAQSFINMDPPEHTRQRRLLTGQFTVRRMAALAPRIENVVDEHLDAIERAGQPADLLEGLALPVSSLVMCELLGVPAEDREHFEELSATMIRLTSDRQQLLAAGAAMQAYMTDLVRAKRQAPGEDVISGLLAAEPVGEPLTERELVSIANLLLIAGHETTANQLALSLLTLIEQPVLCARLRAEPDLTNQAAEELLRYHTVVQFGVTRAVSEDLVFRGTAMTAGEYVVLHLGSGNRDPRQFAEPDELLLERQPNHHLSFGHGVHQCLGQQLARIIMRVVIGKVLARFPRLRAAVPVDQLVFRHDSADYGIRELPVLWS